MFNTNFPKWFDEWNRNHPIDFFRLIIVTGAVGGAVLFAMLIIAFGPVRAVYKEPWVVTGQQLGPRGTGLQQPHRLSNMTELKAANVVPTAVPHPESEGYRAGDVYENLEVLGDLNTGQFSRLMVNMTEWVAPDVGCAACHNVANFAEDSLYTKVVARRMLQMVPHINTDWAPHVGKTGVTCYTCHRGNLVPPNVWFNDPGLKQASGLPQKLAGQNHPARAVGSTSLPRDPLTAFLEGSADARVQGDEPRRPVGSGRSIKTAEPTYALMIHMSQGLGVNCDYCHNTRSFSDWQQSSPQRRKAWYGIRMVRDLNNNYLNPLQPVFPANRLGPATGDAPKVTCATCHNGVFKPLFGQSMIPNFPELKTLAAVNGAAGQPPAVPLFEKPPWE